MDPIACGNFFAVDPKRDCPHIDEHVNPDVELYMAKNMDDKCG